jgi:RHS repeat-associated protein
MRRPIVRLPLALLLCLLLGSFLPPAVTPRASAAPVAAPAGAPLALPPLPNLPKPTQAGSTGYTPAQAEAAAQRYDALHTLGVDVFDGTFSATRRQVATIPDFTQGPTSYTSRTLELPANSYGSVELDVAISTGDWGGGRAVIGLRPLGSTAPVAGIVAVGLGYWDRSATRTNQRITLMGNLPADQPVEVVFECSGPQATCIWGNLRFYDDVPGWRMSELSSGPDNAISIGVEPSGWQGLPAHESSFLGMRISAGYGGGANDRYVYRSPLVSWPELAANDVISATMEWTRSAVTFGEGGGGSIGELRVLFVSVEGWAASLLHTDVITTAAIPWRTINGTQEGRYLSGQRGWIMLYQSRGGANQTMGMDTIRFYRNGAPLDLPLAEPDYVIPDDQTTGLCICREDGTVVGQPQGYQGDPVNTHSGAFVMHTTDMAVPASGPPLRLDRSYVSMFADTSRFHTSWMGPGWRYSAGQLLLLPGAIGSEPGMVIYEHPNGNRVRFMATGAGTYRALPGIRASLRFSAADQRYTLTTRDQERLIFDTQGRILELHDAQGHIQRSIYGTEPEKPDYGLRTQVLDVSSGRSLWFSYDGVGAAEQVRLVSVSNDLGDTVSYTYTSDGDLETVKDLRGGLTHYSYASEVPGGPRYLTQVQQPGDDPTAPSLVNVYQDGKVVSQTDATGARTTLSYAIAADGSQTTTITQELQGQPADVIKHHYRADGSLRLEERNGQFTGYSAFNGAFAPSAILDGNLNAQTFTTNAAGLTTRAVDAAGRSTTVRYDDQNRPTAMQEPDGLGTAHAYDPAGNLTQTLRTIPGGMQITNRYTYDAANRLLAEQRPNGSTTSSTYTPAGDVETVTTGAGTSAALTTRYRYDILGRVTDVIEGDGTPLAARTHMTYRPDGQIESLISNYTGDGRFDPGVADQNIPTSYGYDQLGRLIWTQSADGRYHGYTRYDAMGRVLWRVENPDGLPGATPPAYSPARPDTNVVTLYGYDLLGRTTLITQTGILTGTLSSATLLFSQAASRTTRIEYDGLGRPVTTTLNYRPEITTPNLPDVNVKTYTYYDGAGNPIWQSDLLGRWTRTEYDVLNRPVTTTLNFENGDPASVDPANLGWTDGTDTDLVSVTVYNTLGQPERRIENYVDGIFSASEPLTDRITLSDYTAIGQAITTTLTYDPATVGLRPDTNQTSVTVFDPARGQVRATRDPLGRWSSIQYDALGRVQTTIVNCTTSAGQPVATGCAPLNATGAPDRNLPTTTTYDALGRPVATTLAERVTTRTTYDGLGRVIAATENYVPNALPTADTNVTRRTTYDALGQVVATTDPLGRITRYRSNGLGQTVAVTDPTGAETTFGVEGSGAQRWVRAADGALSVTFVDGLGRPVRTIQNYQSNAARGAADINVTTTVVYDQAGRQRAIIDPLGRETDFTYTLRDQLVAVTENVRPTLACVTTTTNDCNITTRYLYDRAGNRTAVIDPNGHRQRMTTYNAANWPTSERDPLGNEQTWTYDALGRVSRHTTGEATLEYSYNARNQLLQAFTVPSPTVVQTHQYDVLGRMTMQRTVRTAGATSSVQVTYGYDPLNRIVSASQATEPDETITFVSYRYDQAGQLVSLTYPNAKVVEYSYTPRGELDLVREGTAVLADYSYDSTGWMAQATFNNGLQLTQSRDALGRLLKRDYLRSGAIVVGETYTLNQRGERLSRREQRGTTSATEAYTYDGLGRLASATLGTTSRSYGYDRAGNRTSTSVNGSPTTRAYNAANQVLATGWSYDRAGNLRSDGARSYAYDPFGQLTDITTANGTAIANLYAPDGTLVRQSITAGGASQRLDYAINWAAPLSQILQVSSSIPGSIQGTTSERSVYGAERLFTTPDSGKTTSRTWYLTDGLGSVVGTTSTSGATSGSQTYDPWGQPQAAAPARFGFTGELTSAETGLVYLRARWYNPAEGTLLGRDPHPGAMPSPSSLHPYQYGYNNPVSNSDPTGLRCQGSQCKVNTPPRASEPLPPVEHERSLAATICKAKYLVAKAFSHLAPGDESRTDYGYIEGVSVSVTLGVPMVFGIGGGAGGVFGGENVVDIYDFEIGIFTYGGATGNIFSDPGIGGSLYMGGVIGWSNYPSGGVTNYSGPSTSWGGTVPLPYDMNAGLTGFASADLKLKGMVGSVGWSKGVEIPGVKAKPLIPSVSLARASYTLHIQAGPFPHTLMGALTFIDVINVLPPMGQPQFIAGRLFASAMALESVFN